METAICYCRKSDTNATTEDESFENQEDACRKYAQEKGYAVLKVYREAHSGADLDGRTLIWEAISDVEKGEATVLLVRNRDRLARNPQHAAVISYMLQKHGGRVESALDPVDPNDPYAKLVNGMLDLVADVERLNGNARMSRGKRRAAERGDMPGSANPLYGYYWLVDIPGERDHWGIDEEAAKVIRRIFHLGIAGHSLRAIAKQLNADQVPTRAQRHAANGHIGRRLVGSGWNAEQVRRIVSERTYTGTAEAYRWQRVKSKTTGKSVIAPRPEDYPLRVKIAVPAIIDQATFDAANAALKTSDDGGRPPLDEEATWLRGHVYCGCCYGRMYVKRVDNAYKYECRNRKGMSTVENACPGGDFSVRTHLLDEHAYTALTQAAGDLDKMRALMLQKLGYEKIAALTSMSEAFQARITEKTAEYDRTRRLAAQVDEAVAADMLRDAAGLKTEIQGLEKEYADARDKLDNFSSGSTWVDTAIARIRANLPTPNPTEEDIRALSLELRRFLLEASGFCIAVYPVGYHPAGKRSEVVFMWSGEHALSPAEIRKQHAHLQGMMRQYLRGELHPSQAATEKFQAMIKPSQSVAG